MSTKLLKRFAFMVFPVIFLALTGCSNDAATPAPAVPPAAAAVVAPSTDSSGAPAKESTATTGVSTGVLDPTATSQTIGVVTTSNIVADWAREVGQERVDVLSLLPPNADPHTFQPGAKDIARVSDANPVVAVGLSLEASWLDDLLQNAAQVPHDIVDLGERVDPIDFMEIFEEHATEEGELLSLIHI